MTIQEIKKLFEQKSPEQWDSLFEAFEADSRKGVRMLVNSFRRRRQEQEAEMARLKAMSRYEREYGHLGLLCGIDEVGRGPLAGPVVACAMVLPEGCCIPDLNDSKQLSASKREELYEVIISEAIEYGIGMADHDRIDQINILNATYEAMREAVSKLKMPPAVLLNDAVTIPGVDFLQVPIIKGDAKSISIAAASITAKVTRDRMMEEIDALYPEYGFAANKGYGTAAHIAALKKYGPCPIHRKSFIGHFVSM